MPLYTRHSRPGRVSAAGIGADPYAEAEANLDFTTDPRGEYLAGQRLAPAAPAAGDPLTLLRQLAQAAAPGAKCKVGGEEEHNGFAVPVRLYWVELFGPEVGQAVVRGRGHSPQAATEGLRRAWAQARRAHDIELLLGELGRLRGEPLTAEQRAYTSAKLLECRSADDFRHLAARYRDHATSQQAA